jgi:hypothetical protein
MSEPKFNLAISAEVEVRTLREMEVSLQKQILQAQTLGRSFEEQAKQLNTVRSRLEALTAATPAAGPAPAAVDESTRYTQQLEKMSVAAREAADAEAYAILKSEAHAAALARKQLESEEVAIAQADLARQTKTYSAEEVDALTKSGRAADEATGPVKKLSTTKKDLNDIVRGLAAQYPMLGAAMRLAINPVAGIVAGIAGAFTLWNTRVKELTVSLGGMKMPDISTGDIERIHQAAAAWKDWAEQAGKSTAAEDELSQSMSRARAEVQSRLQMTLALLQAQRDLAKAQDQRPESQPEIDAEFDAAERAAKKAAKDEEIDLLIKEEAQLRAIGQAKIDAAAGLKTGAQAERYDAETERKFQLLIEGGKDETGANVVGTEATKQDARKRLKDIQSARENDPTTFKGLFQKMWADTINNLRYGVDATYEDGEAMEKARIDKANQIEAQYAEWLKSQEIRGALRDQKKQGEADIKKADEMAPKTRDEIIGAQQSNENQEQVDAMKREAARIRAAEEQRKLDEQENRKRAQEEDRDIGRGRRSGQDVRNRNNRDAGDLSAVDLAPVEAAGDAVAGSVDDFANTMVDRVVAKFQEIEQRIADAKTKIDDGFNV